MRPRLDTQGSHLPATLTVGDGGQIAILVDPSLPLVELVSAALENSPDLTIDLEVINTDLETMDPVDVIAATAQAAARWRAVYEAD